MRASTALTHRRVAVHRGGGLGQSDALTSTSSETAAVTRPEKHKVYLLLQLLPAVDTAWKNPPADSRASAPPPLPSTPTGSGPVGRAMILCHPLLPLEICCGEEGGQETGVVVFTDG